MSDDLIKKVTKEQTANSKLKIFRHIRVMTLIFWGFLWTSIASDPVARKKRLHHIGAVIDAEQLKVKQV